MLSNNLVLREKFTQQLKNTQSLKCTGMDPSPRYACAGTKRSLNKFKGIEIIQTMFSEHNEIKLKNQ